MDRAQELFERIRVGGVSYIERLVSQKIVEEHFLDYKRTATTVFSSLHGDDRGNLAKAVSGFANSEGGVIVWGVSCKRSNDGDVPDALFPVANALAYKTLIDEAIHGATLPPHQTVESIHLRYADGQNGFVATHVPAGNHVPYRAMIGKEDYFIRAGSSFSRAPHGVLAGYFGRRPHPRIQFRPEISALTREIISRPTASGIVHDFKGIFLCLRMHLFNAGRGMARELFMTAEGPKSPCRNCS